MIATETDVVDVVVDAQFLYFGNDRGDLQRVPRNGGSPALLTSIPGTGILFLAIDESNIYFQSRNLTTNLDSVYAMPKTGGDATLLIANVRSAFEMIPDGEWLYVLAVGTLGPGAWQADGQIVRVTKDGSVNETIASRLKAPAGMELDGDVLYFTEAGTGPMDATGGVRRVAKSGGAVTSVATVAGAWALAQDKTMLYVLRITGSDRGAIDAVSKVDGTATPLLSGIGFDVIEPMEVFADSLYFMNLLSNTTARIEVLPLGGGERRILREFQWEFPQFAIDSCGVYFSTPFAIERALH